MIQRAVMGAKNRRRTASAEPRKGPDKPKVLLISHEASRTGAPRVAVLIAKVLSETGARVEVLSRAPGPMIAEFEAIAPTSIEFLHRARRKLWRMPPMRLPAYLIDTALAFLCLLRRRPGVLYLNSTSAAIYLRPALWLRLPVVLHVHESAELAAIFLKPARAAGLLGRVQLVACSPSVRGDLVTMAAREASRVVLLPSVPDDLQVSAMAAEDADHPYLADELVVGCCGTVERRKGADLFVAMANTVHHAIPDVRVRFVWVGQARESIPAHDPGWVTFVGASANPYAHMKRFDVATLPSRDDPFPLVVLESMLVGKPVVAFDVGDVGEQIGDGGVTVPPGDVEAFADEVVRLLVDADARHRLGQAAAARVHRLYSTRAFADGVVDVMKELTGTTPSRSSSC